MQRLATEPQGAEPAAALPDTAQAVQQGIDRCHPCLAAVPCRALSGVRLHAAGLRDHPDAVDRSAAGPGCRRNRVGRLVCLGQGVHFTGGDGCRYGFRQHGRKARNADRLPGRAGAADGAFFSLADLPIDLAGDDRRNARAPRTGDLPGAGLCCGGVHHGLAGRERARAGRQPEHPPRTDDDP